MADRVTIGGRPVEVAESPADSDFRELNLLGTDFFCYCRDYLAYDYKNREVKFFVGGKQEPPPKS